MRPCCALALVALAVGVGSVLGCGKKDDKKGLHQAAAPAQRRPGEPAADQKGGDAPAAKELQRKIVYTATVRLIVEDFAKSARDLDELIKTHKGYVVQSDVSGRPGTPRSGEWKVRVPVERFDAFQAAVPKLGELQKTNIDSQDVTDEFYDVEARIRNFEKEEASLLDVLQKSTGKLEDVLAVRREVSRVRGEIERLQGRRQLLKNLSDLATVTVHLDERGSYVPEESASFGTVLGRALRDSAAALVNVGKGLTLAVVALTPWLIVLAVLGIPIALVWRRWRGRVVLAAAVPAPAEPPPPPQQETPKA